MARRNRKHFQEVKGALSILIILILMTIGGLIYTYAYPQGVRRHRNSNVSTHQPASWDRNNADDADATNDAGTTVDERVEITLDQFYQHSAVQNVQDLRKLPAEYTCSQAEADGAATLNYHRHNHQPHRLARDFMSGHYDKSSPAFLRFCQTTVEGDPILTDVLYHDNGNVYIVTDRTRDRFSTDADRVITIEQYDRLRYASDHNGDNWWVAERHDAHDHDHDEVYWIMPWSAANGANE